MSPCFDLESDANDTVISTHDLLLKIIEVLGQLSDNDKSFIQNNEILSYLDNFTIGNQNLSKNMIPSIFSKSSPEMV